MGIIAKSDKLFWQKIRIIQAITYAILLPMKQPRIFHVLVVVNLAAEANRRMLTGIHQFLGEGHDWDFELIRDKKDLTAERLTTAAKECDGFIVSGEEPTEIRRLHARLGVPTVFIDNPDERLLRTFRRCVFIEDDNRGIGRTAAGRLTAQGTCKGFGYAETSLRRFWNRQRGDAFVAALEVRGKTASRFRSTETRSREELIRWLRSLPKPAGVFAAYDDTAKHVLDACREAGLKVPDEVSVLGVGNDELICTHVTPGLSSIVPDFEENGYRAARELQAMMLRSRIPLKHEFLCGIKGIEERGSTPGSLSSAALVQRALAYIEAHALEGISAREVAAHLRVSRRLADLRFREIRRTSILQTILDIRLAEVKRLLAETSLPISEIAAKCGCESGSLKNLFRRHFGVSMRDWRRQGAVSTR